MKNLFEVQSFNEINSRIALLREESLPLWGKMNVSQMLAHCTLVLRNALGETQQSRQWYGYIIAPFIRSKFYDDSSYKKKNVPSSFIINDSNDFAHEKEVLVGIVEEFHRYGRDRCIDSVHPILGKFTPDQWAIGQYKHLDHHLRQFGV